jgi:hypothetical protein
LKGRPSREFESQSAVLDLQSVITLQKLGAAYAAEEG